ncbi:MAG: hypothetical protein ABIS03_08490 [Gemmatimonadaceae bacterium]
MRIGKSTKVAGLIAICAVIGGVGGCLGTKSTGPQLTGEGRRVLFIGNSYLYFQDIPEILRVMADSAGGDKLAVETVARPNFALVDHVFSGSAVTEIRKGGWEWVVLQQGPSSVEVNRDTLRAATKVFDSEISKVGAKTALFSAWPTQDRRQDFPRAIESYQLAAADVKGIFVPIATAWVAAWDRDASVQLYADALHPNAEGAYLSALVLYARLLGKSPVGLPSRLQLRNGEVISIPAARAALLQAAAAEAIASK